MRSQTKGAALKGPSVCASYLSIKKNIASFPHKQSATKAYFLCVHVSQICHRRCAFVY